MGVVYRAERVRLGRIVAIKVLHDELPNELSSRKRFEIEAVAMAKLEHPHCAAVLDVGIHEDKPYVVMDFVSGENLKDIIAQGPVPVVRAVEIVRQVLSGLAHAHEHGIIHRDIKPANIVLSQKSGLGDHVKILDFGLARLTADKSNLTTGIVVGTPSYMAPEQIRGVAIDHRADLYACGILLFELLTSNKPFHSKKDDPIEVCTMHLKQPVPRLADFQPGIQFGELEDVVAKALAKTPDDRYSTAEEFANALDIVPRRRTATPVAGLPVAAAATPSGWAMPSDATGAGLFGKPSLGSGPTSASMSHRGSSPAVAQSAPPASGPHVAPASVPSSGPTSAPPGPMPASAPITVNSGPAQRPSLPPSFDLSLAIPQPPAAPSTGSGGNLEPGFDLAVAPPEAPETPIFEFTSRPAPDPAKQTIAFLGAAPAGPSPLAMRDATPIPEAAISLPSPPPPAPQLPFTRKQLAIAGGSVFGLVLIIAIIAASGGSSSPATATDATAVGNSQKPAPRGPVDDQLARANELMAKGQPDAAIDQLLAARRVFPDDARLAYLAGKLYFGKLWWSAGVKQFRDTLRLDPTYRTDAELIKIVLKAFITPSEYQPELAGFLRNDIGPPAKAFLEETASTHPRASVRARAAAELKRIP
jgi:serine/threonine-protein kinase